MADTEWVSEGALALGCVPVFLFLLTERIRSGRRLKGPYNAGSYKKARKVEGGAFPDILTRKSHTDCCFNQN